VKHPVFREIHPPIRSLLVYSANGRISNNTLNVDKMPSVFIRDEPTFSSERMLHKDYYRKGSVEKENSGHDPQGVWCQDELIGGKPPVAK
jgi:hypothetical protein